MPTVRESITDRFTALSFPTGDTNGEDGLLDRSSVGRQVQVSGPDGSELYPVSIP